ncbi:2536_t:CDS:2 [Funneliformis geosporum]|uniref:2268_t:CDS:1 n=1 Tax=Funneliformis geosporum TaxID=1117311 RepID=A0A9W4SX36_9GLOM|nr:2268_t:CDS:2 [Funneliformis geosporum]CAI2188227.1 2536_t:CDS:2 [Funneliformis geosporum]
MEENKVEEIILKEKNSVLCKKYNSSGSFYLGGEPVGSEDIPKSLRTKINGVDIGGLHEVGKNCYILEKNEDIIIVDCGIKFLNGSNLADGTVPNFSYLLANREKIKGLFITHGHEDHIGGIPYLLKLIPNIPVYGSEFSASLVKNKLRGEELKKKVELFHEDKPIRVGEFRVNFFRVTHSIPGSFGLVVEVIKDNFRIVITGDFNDSTNAEVEGNTPSESKIVRRLENIIAEATGRVIITSFASNVYRLKKVIEIAKRTDKKIVLLGKDIAKTPNNKLIIFCTGSQGEERAVLSRLAHQIYEVEKVSNKLFALGAKVYENSKEDLLHASGHACQEDLKLMLTMVKPRYFMPFHGDFRMLKKHGHLAQELGIPAKNIFVCSNGEVVEAKGKEFFLSKKTFPAQPNYVLNGRLLPMEELSNNLTLREKMSQGGFLLVISGLIMNKNHQQKEPNWGEEVRNYMEEELLKN